MAQLGQRFIHTESWKYKVAGSENHRLRGCGLLPALQGYPGSWTPQQRIPVHHFCHPGNWPRTGGSNTGRARPCWRHLKDPCLQTPSERPQFRPGSTLSGLPPMGKQAGRDACAVMCKKAPVPPTTPDVKGKRKGQGSRGQERVEINSRYLHQKD